jgi:hypothetical protein
LPLEIVANMSHAELILAEREHSERRIKRHNRRAERKSTNNCILAGKTLVAGQTA